MPYTTWNPWATSLEDGAPLQTLLNNLQDYFGNTHNFEASNKLCDIVLEIAYFNGNIRICQDVLYAKWWNADQVKTAGLINGWALKNP